MTGEPNPKAKATTPLPPLSLWQAAKRGHVRKLAALVEQKAAEQHTPNNWLLQTILAVFRHNNPQRRIQMIEVLVPHWEWQNHSVGVRRGTLDNALHEKAFECMPLLYRIGYSLRHDSGQADISPNAKSGRGLMAACLGQGHWPHPDLLCPDLFCADDAPQMLVLWADNLLNWKGDNWPARELICDQHIARLAPLMDKADAGVVRMAMGQALARSVCHSDGWKQFKHLGKLEEGLDKLLALGWLGEAEFETALGQSKSPRNPADPKAVDTLRRLLAMARTRVMETHTHEAAACSGRGGLRL